jgi:hypothetical protein
MKEIRKEKQGINSVIVTQVHSSFELIQLFLTAPSLLALPPHLFQHTNRKHKG